MLHEANGPTGQVWVHAYGDKDLDIQPGIGEDRPDSQKRMAIYLVTTNHDLVSPNKMLRQHWAVRRRTKELLKEEIKFGWGINPHEVDPCHITIVRYINGRKKAMDPDNLVGATKLHLDAMKEVGIISDDNPECISIEVSQMRSDDFDGVKIWVREK